MPRPCTTSGLTKIKRVQTQLASTDFCRCVYKMKVAGRARAGGRQRIINRTDSRHGIRKSAPSDSIGRHRKAPGTLQSWPGPF
jgi:hypothetical protein